MPTATVGRLLILGNLLLAMVTPTALVGGNATPDNGRCGLEVAYPRDREAAVLSSIDWVFRSILPHDSPPPADWVVIPGAGSSTKAPLLLGTMCFRTDVPDLSQCIELTEVQSFSYVATTYHLPPTTGHRPPTTDH
jgi:hypothetical protein